MGSYNFFFNQRIHLFANKINENNNYFSSMPFHSNSSSLMIRIRSGVMESDRLMSLCMVVSFSHTFPHSCTA